MTRRRLIIGASIAVAAVGCWWCVVRPWRQLSEAGITLHARGLGWRCLYSAMAFECVRQPKTNLVRLDLVSGSLRTMSLQQIEHEWQVRDSLEWSYSRDSITRALVRRGAVPHTCDAMDAMLSTPPEPGVIRLRGAVPLHAWRLPDQDELVGAQHGPAASDWTINIVAFPGRLPICQTSHRRLMTIREALAAIHRTIAEQIGF